MKKYTGIIMLALGVVSCQHRNGKNFTVSGSVSGLPVKEVYLTTIPLDNKPVLIMDSASVLNGKFELKGPGGEEQLYRVMFGDPNNAPFAGVISDESSVDLSMDGTQDGKYTVKGSPASERYRILTDSLRVLLEGIQQIKEAQYKNNDTSAGPIAEQKVNAFYGYLAQTAKDDPSPVIAAFALNFYGIGADQQSAASYGVDTKSYDVALLASIADQLSKKFPGNKNVAATVSGIQHLLNVPRVGAMAPDLSLPDTSGKLTSLSSFKGKYVLVDFWASWCGPCRGENPNVVKAYQQFKDKNFAIVGVSLDQKKDEWLKAIHDDHLTWTHISDLQFWQSKAVEAFQFNGIPYNVLLDPQGRIIATSLRGEALEDELKAVLQ